MTTKTIRVHDSTLEYIKRKARAKECPNDTLARLLGVKLPPVKAGAEKHGMNEDLFPSGEWVGFSTHAQAPDKHRMDLYLSFTVDGQIQGNGSDDLGTFTVRGRYDTNELKVYFTKSYEGAQDVGYEGTNNDKRIYGSWRIGTDTQGDFKIWPMELGEDDSVDEERHEEDEPSEAVHEPPLVLTNI